MMMIVLRPKETYGNRRETNFVINSTDKLHRGVGDVAVSRIYWSN